MADASRPKSRAVQPPTARGLSREEAAGYISVSPSHFDKLVHQGAMPSPVRLGRRAVWDRWAIDLVFDRLSGNADPSSANDWDDVL